MSSDPETDKIQQRLHRVRDRLVMLDSDIAEIYGVSTGALNQAIVRNLRRFPDDFSFVVEGKEFANLISQTVISNTYQKLLPLLAPPPTPPRPRIGFQQDNK